MTIATAQTIPEPIAVPTGKGGTIAYQSIWLKCNVAVVDAQFQL